MAEYKKGGLTGNSNLYATNRLFVKNPLFKKRKKKAPGVYSPTAKFRYKEGGTKDKSPAYIEKDLTREEIEKYRKGGYIVEEVNDPSISKLGGFAKGGAQGCPQGTYWNGTKCTKLITLKNDKKYIDGVANWAMHVSDPNKITSAYNDSIKERLYGGKWGLDPESGALVKLSAVQPKSVTTLDAKTKADREREKKEQEAQRIRWESQDTYRQSIIDAGFDPATFGKAKGVNTITGEPIYASSKEEAERINQEAINQFAIEGNAAIVNNPVFKTAAYMTPVGMAIGVMEGAARLAPDVYDFAKDPSWSGAGQIVMDVVETAPLAKPLASAVKAGAKGLGKALDKGVKTFGTSKALSLPNKGLANLDDATQTITKVPKRTYQTNDYAKGVDQHVDALYKEFPELANMGTKEQYKQHIQSIFPESNFPDVYLHGTKNKDVFNASDWNMDQTPGASKNLGMGHYFTPDPNKVEAYTRDGRLLRALVDVKKPSYTSIKNNSLGLGDQTTKELLGDKDALINLDYYANKDMFKNNGKYSEFTGKLDETMYPEHVDQDGYKFVHKFDEFSIPNKEQIHILGSPDDLKRFQEFTNKPSSELYYKSKNTGTNTSTSLTEADIAAARAEEEAWLTSDEYLKRRMKNTGESAKAVREDVAEILKRADKGNYNVNANLSGVHGAMSTNPFINPKVSVNKTAPNPKAVLRHENIHLYSPVSKNKSIFGKDLHKGWDNPDVANLPASKRGVYANYPTIGDAPESLAYADQATYDYNMLGYEQQARHLGAMRDIAAKNNVDLNAGKKLTEQQVRDHLDDFAKTRKDVDYDYDAIWSAEVNKEQLKLADELGTTLTILQVTNPTKYKEVMRAAKDNAAKTITKVLNNAWVVAPTVGVAGTAAMLANPFQGSNVLQQQKKGGSTTDAIEIDIPEEEIQWYIDNGYIVEPVTKLKKFIG